MKTTDNLALPTLHGSLETEQDVANLVSQFLQAWSAGKKPSPERYLKMLRSDASRNEFKQAVAMGKILKQVLV